MIKEYQVAAGVMAFSTTRRGGVSQGNYGEFNINEYCGDFAQHVAENRKRLAAELGVTTDHIIMPHQVHGVEVRNIAGEFLTMPENIRKMVLEGVDAVMTDQKGVCIGVSTADCIPVLLYDEEHHAVAAIHAGWRGTVKQIVAKTVEYMIARHGCDPSLMLAGIAPSICKESFEVGDEVAEAFRATGVDMNCIMERNARTGKAHIDLWEANRMQLLQSGLQPEQIEVSGICTYQHPDDFFSARRLGIKSGRILSGIMIKD